MFVMKFTGLENIDDILSKSPSFTLEKLFFFKDRNTDYEL